MINQKNYLTAVVAALGLGFVLSKATAGQPVPIVSVNPVTQYRFNEDHFDGMIGWTFNLQNTTTISQVGWYDDGQDGLSRAYQIGLWQDLTGTADSILLYCNFQTSNPYSIIGDRVHGITSPSGTSATLNGAYRVVNLPSPRTLPPGNYELGGLDTASTTDPIRYVWGQYQSPVAGMTQGPFFYAGTDHGTTTLGTTQYLYLEYGLELGPMLFTSAPEPSTLGLLILSGLFLGWRGRERSFSS